MHNQELAPIAMLTIVDRNPHLVITVNCRPRCKMWAFSIFNVVSDMMFYRWAHRDEIDSYDDLMTNALGRSLGSLTRKTVNSLKRDIFGLDSLQAATRCGCPLRLEIVACTRLKGLVNRVSSSPSELLTLGFDKAIVDAIRSLEQQVYFLSEVSGVDPRMKALDELMDQMDTGPSPKKEPSSGYCSYMDIAA